jgi:hypothetical protein
MNIQIKSRIRHQSTDRLHPDPQLYQRHVNSRLKKAYSFDNKLARLDFVGTPLFHEHRAMCLNLSYYSREFDFAFKDTTLGNEQRFANITAKLDVALASYTVVAERALREYKRQLTTLPGLFRLVTTFSK